MERDFENISIEDLIIALFNCNPEVEGDKNLLLDILKEIECRGISDKCMYETALGMKERGELN